MKLSKVYGQARAVAGLRSWLKSPTSKAFLFSGETGTGKTFTAEIIAHELDAAPGDALGGLVEIPSGEQTAETVRATLRSLHNRPMAGSGWKVLIVNEADFMSTQAQAVWLDGLENLPAKTVVVFTTNDPDKLPARFVDRCEHYEFESAAGNLRDAAELLVAERWHAATGGNHAPTLEDVQGEAMRAGACAGVAASVAELVAWLCHGTAREVTAINDPFQLAQVNDAAHTARDLVEVTR